jgi:hypothetical protein
LRSSFRDKHGGLDQLALPFPSPKIDGDRIDLESYRVWPNSEWTNPEDEQRTITQVCEMLLHEGVEAYKKEEPKFMQRLVAKQKLRTKWKGLAVSDRIVSTVQSGKQLPPENAAVNSIGFQHLSLPIRGMRIWHGDSIHRRAISDRPSGNPLLLTKRR